VKDLVTARIMLKNIETIIYNFTETEQDHARELASDLEEKKNSTYLALLPKHQRLILHSKSPTTQYMRRKEQN